MNVSPSQIIIDRQAGTAIPKFVGSMVEYLECRDRDEHGPGSKPIRAILLYPWERHLMALSLLGSLGKQF